MWFLKVFGTLSFAAECSGDKSSFLGFVFVSVLRELRRVYTRVRWSPWYLPDNYIDSVFAMVLFLFESFFLFFFFLPSLSILFPLLFFFFFLFFFHLVQSRAFIEIGFISWNAYIIIIIIMMQCQWNIIIIFPYRQIIQIKEEEEEEKSLSTIRRIRSKKKKKFFIRNWFISCVYMTNNISMRRGWLEC